jgi:hypothetical protein
MYDVKILESFSDAAHGPCSASERSVDDCVGSGHGIVFESYLIYERLHVLCSRTPYQNVGVVI